MNNSRVSRVRTRVAAVAALGLMMAGGVATAGQAETVNCSRSDFGCVSGYTASSTGTWTEKYYGAPWGNNGHNCTRYAGFRLAQNGLGDPGITFGNAKDWARTVTSKYGAQVVNTTPTVGSIAHWDAGEGKGALGHVAYVEQVFADGSFVITEDNLGGTTRNVTYAKGEGPKRFLHLADVPAFTTAPTPTISGTAVVDSTLTAVEGTWSPVPSSFAYQWLRGSTVVGTGRSYTLVQADIGQSITLKVIGKRTGYADMVRTSAAKVVTAGSFTFTGATAALSGTAKVEYSLTSSTSLQTSGATTTITWLRNGAVRQNGGTTLALTSADIGTQIAVRYTFAKKGYKTTSYTSNAVTVAGYTAYSFSGSPAAISGTAKLGFTLSASSGLTTSGVTRSINWYANGVLRQSGGTTFTPTTSDVGKSIVVKFSFDKQGYAYTTYASSAVTIAGYSNYSFSGNPVAVSGTAKVGKTVQAVSGLTTSGVTRKYQWLKNGVAISGATASTYTLKSADKGQRISVRMTLSKQGYATTSYTSSAVTVTS